MDKRRIRDNLAFKILDSFFMGTKEIILPDGWEIKKYSGNKIIIGEKERKLPMTWKECAIVVNDFEKINIYSEVISLDVDEMKYQIGDDDKKLLPKGLGEPMLALCQLLICRNAWWKRLGWRPDWENGFEDKFFIGNYRGIIDKGRTTTWDRVLAFPTSEVRDKFLDTFHALIEEAKELL